MARDRPAGAIAWIVVGPDTDPLVAAHIEHAGVEVVGGTHRGDDWREALAWAPARTDQVYIRFDYSDTTYWAGAGSPTDRDPPAEPFWAAATGGMVERAGVLGRMVDGALAAQPGVHPELLVCSREPPGRVTLTVEVADLDARVRWLRDLGGTVVHRSAGAALVEDPEGNRALLVALPPDRPAPYRG